MGVIKKLSWVTATTSVLFTLTGCATTVLNPVSDMSHRQSVLSSSNCGLLYRQLDHRITSRADVDRGPYQIRRSPDLDRFDTNLFRRWQENMPAPIYSAIQEQAYDSEFSFTPHILNYEVLGDIYYHGCKAESQTAVGRIWYGDRSPVEQNKARAALHYEFAAIGHVSRAQYRIGRMLVEGDGVPQDMEMGLQWLMAAAIEGNNDARGYLKKKGIENIPNPISPNTFQVLAVNEHQMREQYRQRLSDYTQQRQAQTRQNWASLFTIGLVVLGAYYSADVTSSAPSASLPSTAAQPGRVTVQRAMPVFCNSQINMTGITSGSLMLVNGTISTFCPGA